MQLDFAKKLRLMRQTEDLTQAEIAQILEIPRITYQTYERGAKKISGENLMRITNHPRFRKYALWLVTDTESPPTDQNAPENYGDIETDDPQTANYLRKLDENRRRQLAEYIKFLATQPDADKNG